MSKNEINPTIKGPTMPPEYFNLDNIAKKTEANLKVNNLEMDLKI